MTFALDKDLVRRALSGHAVVGLIASALLYIVCVSGTVVVLYEEWQRIEQPHAPEMRTIAPEAVKRAVTEMAAREAGKPRTTHLYVHMPSEGLPRTTVTTDSQAFHVAADGRLAMPEENGWAEFLLVLHYMLNLPAMLGAIVVGMLGVAMLALSVSGVLAHPRIFRDAFRLRARDNSAVGLADWHNRLSVWTLPFGIALALTGAVIGLALPSAYAIAARFYGGDMTATYATIFGAEGKPDARPAPMPDVVAPLRWMAEHAPGIRPTYVTIHDPGTAGQHVQIFGAHPRRLIYGDAYNFDANGRFHDRAGLSDGAAGKQAAASIYNLHFGNFGGLTVKLAYVAIGLALCIVVGTGTSIWLDKRARRGLSEPRLRSAWSAIVWGTPAMLTLAFVSRMAIGNSAPLAAIFWIGLALILGVAIGWARQDCIKAGLRWLWAAGTLLGLVLALAA